MRRHLGLALIVAATLAHAQDPPAARLDNTALARNVETLLKLHGQGIVASLWLGGASGNAWFQLDSGRPNPTASAIKTFYLVELFDLYKGKLDHSLPGSDAILNNDNHPAISHFSKEQREEIRRELRGASVRRIGQVMTGATEASNAVYNAAANLTTAALGGPEALTARIRRRDHAFAQVSARRYMLRDRREPGDNEAPAQALAVLYQRLASRHLAGIDNETMNAIHESLRRANHSLWGRNFSKDGNLASDPLTKVRAGWWQTPRGPMLYVVMTSQSVPGPSGRDASEQQLGRTADALVDALGTAGWAAIQQTPRFAVPKMRNEK